MAIYIAEAGGNKELHIKLSPQLANLDMCTIMYSTIYMDSTTFSILTSLRTQKIVVRIIVQDHVRSH